MTTTEPQKPVLIVSERALEAARHSLPGYDVIAYHGKSRSNGKLAAFTEALRGRHVDIWEDAGDDGASRAAVLSSLLLPICDRVRIVHTKDAAPGWSIADAVSDGWDTARLIAWGKEHLVTPSVQPPDLNPSQKPPESPTTDISTVGTIDQPAYVLWEQLNLARNERGPYATESNALRIMSAHNNYSGRIWLDEFSQRLMIDDRLFSRTDAIACLVWMQEALQLPKMPLAAVERAAVLVGERNKRHPLKTYLNGLKWDGVERLPSLMHNAFGAADDNYAAAVGRCWLVAMIARVYQPFYRASNTREFAGHGIGLSLSMRILRSYGAEITITSEVGKGTTVEIEFP